MIRPLPHGRRSTYRDTEAAELQLARAELKVAQAGLRKAENRLASTRLTSPLDGLVIRRSVQVGERVRGDSPDELLTLADTSRLKAQIFVPEIEISTLKRGGLSTFEARLQPNQVLEGRLVRTDVAQQPNVRIAPDHLRVRQSRGPVPARPERDDFTRAKEADRCTVHPGHRGGRVVRTMDRRAAIDC